MKQHILSASSNTVRLSPSNGFTQILDITSTYPWVNFAISDESIVECYWYSREWNNNVAQFMVRGLKEGTTNVFLYYSEGGGLNNAIASITLSVTVSMNFGSVDTDPGTVDTHPGSVDTHPGPVDTYPGSVGTSPAGSEGLWFLKYGNGYEVSCGTCADAEIVIPATYNGLPVVAISNVAFWDKSNIKSVTIPDSVTSIGDSAFNGCTNLVSITIPDSVTSVGRTAFGDCSSLVSITIPDGVTDIGRSAFSGCTGLTSIDLPDNLQTIGDSAFEGCTGLTSIDLPDNLQTIGRSAFEGCTGITVLKTGSKLKSIGNSGFSGCRNLTTVILSDSVEIIGTFAFYNCVRLTNLYLGSGLTDIYWSAFSSCKSLTHAFYNGTTSTWKKVINEGLNCNIYPGEQPVGNIVDIKDRMTKILAYTGKYNGIMYFSTQFKNIVNCENISEFRFRIDVYDTNGKITYTFTYSIASDGTDSLNKLFALPNCANAQGYEVTISQISIIYKDGSAELAFTDFGKTISTGTFIENVNEDKIVNPSNSTKFN